MEVLVKYNQLEKTLPLLVVRGDGRSLFERNWFSRIALDWKDIHQVMNSSLKNCFRSPFSSVPRGTWQAQRLQSQNNTGSTSYPTFL